MSGERAKSGKKHRKYGRNKRFCDRYKLEGRREKNKAKKEARHVKRMEKQQDKKDECERKITRGHPPARE
jgi:hypothetical protein